MLTVLYFILRGLFGISLTWQAFGAYQKNRSSYTLLLLIVLAGLAYDVFMIAVGTICG
ncbi:MAG: hypothetical protein IPG80_10380 [Anaerolineales bacterium]|uniref:hypothetical protein n=1 Tax=Candidatus Villigracilis vicinus TaxID=3140679 RepID=UPI0031369284|nr:hypothetical protein [Anaerolineales bacterium]